MLSEGVLMRSVNVLRLAGLESEEGERRFCEYLWKNGSNLICYR